MKFQTILLAILVVAGVGVLAYRGIAAHSKLSCLPGDCRSLKTAAIEKF